MTEMNAEALSALQRWAELADKAARSLRTAVQWAEHNGIGESEQDDPVCLHVTGACSMLYWLAREMSAAFDIDEAEQGEDQ
jgi:methionine synthase II (cobalamin-independent)